jgi:hypothetical protein
MNRKAKPTEPVPTEPLYQDRTGSERDVFLKRIADLKPFDEAGARVIIADAVKAGLSDLAIETLIKPLAEALGVTIPLAKKFWGRVVNEARDAAAAEALKHAAEQQARSAREGVEQRQQATADEHDRLWSSCSKIAESPTLLADMEKLVRDLGMIGESASIRGSYIVASSRLCHRGALCLARRGAAAGGKNYLILKTLMLIPADAVVHISSGSPMSLIYYGEGDENALAHKVLYIPEAAVLAERNGVESPLTFMLRTLISEGRLDHLVTVSQATGLPVGMHVRRNGPVVVIITSARDNIEEEMMTRLAVQHADESGDQTKAVVAGVLRDDIRRVGEDEIEPWLDFQRWLEKDAPYDVVIPFRAAILTAFNELWDEMRTVPLRIRRDVNALIIAIETSAILHKAQREKDATGRIVATLDDYADAHDAFDAGLATLYQTKIPETALAVVKAAEALGATKEKGVKITVSALMKKLGINGRGVANSRLWDAEDRGFLNLVDLGKGHGRTSPRVYELGKTSAEVAALIESGSAGQCVFPRVEAVKNTLAEASVFPTKNTDENPPPTFWYKGTVGTDGGVVPTVPLYQRAEGSFQSESFAGKTEEIDESAMAETDDDSEGEL